MKKISLLLVLVLILMTACSSAQTQDPLVSGSELSCGEVYMFDSFEEYNTFISSKRLPDDFVNWESVSELGYHDAFLPTEDFPLRYIYSFCDREILTEGTQCMELEITHNVENENLPTSKEYKIMSVTKNMANMRLADAEERGSENERSVIIRNNVQYEYWSFGPGLLRAITWYHNGVKFRLTGDIDTISTPLFDRLVSISETEAAAAFAEIKQSLDARK